MLAHFIEEEGVPTTQISLIRLHTERISPPRALWVSFELGRPLGMPNDAALQKRVLIAALRLLEASSGPVLEDYPEDAPTAGEQVTVLSCPVGFVQELVDPSETERLCRAFKREYVSLRPWYDMAAKNRGRTTVGIGGVPLDEISDFLCSFLEEEVPQSPRADVALPYALSLVVNDLKAYYAEAMTAQPGQESISSQVLLDWFWEETAAGKVLLQIKESSRQSGDPLMQLVGTMLIVPVSVAGKRKNS